MESQLARRADGDFTEDSREESDEGDALRKRVHETQISAILCHWNSDNTSDIAVSGAAAVS